MEPNKFYGRVSQPASRALTETRGLAEYGDDEVDLVRDSSPNKRDKQAREKRNLSKEGAINLTLHQRPRKGTPNSAASRSGFQVVLDSSPRPQSLTHSYNPEWDEADELVTTNLEHSRGGPSQMISCGIKEPAVPKQLTRDGSISAPRTTEETPKRKRGRPKGSTNLTPAERLQRAERHQNKTAPDYKLKKKRGRPPKLPSPGPERIFADLRPTFIPFLCEWEDCKAGLQNMDTLRQHIKVVHYRSEVCKWGKCSRQEPPIMSRNRRDLLEHVEQMHLVPFEWHMGDGYLNSLVLPREDSENIPPYLLDKDGEQVTPWVKDQEVEDFDTFRENRRRLRELLQQRDDNAPFEEDDNQVVAD